MRFTEVQEELTNNDEDDRDRILTKYIFDNCVVAGASGRNEQLWVNRANIGIFSKGWCQRPLSEYYVGVLEDLIHKNPYADTGSGYFVNLTLSKADASELYADQTGIRRLQQEEKYYAAGGQHKVRYINFVGDSTNTFSLVPQTTHVRRTQVWSNSSVQCRVSRSTLVAW